MIIKLTELQCLAKRMQMLTLTLVAVSMWMFFIVKWTFQFHQPSTEAVIYSKIKQIRLS